MEQNSLIVGLYGSDYDMMVSNLYMEAIKASNMYYVLVLDVTPPFVCCLHRTHTC